MTPRVAWASLGVVLFARALAAAPPAETETTTEPETTAPVAPVRPDSTALDEAKERYIRALELVSEGVYDAALLEFKKAYELAPTYKLFYNMALVSQRLNDFAGAYRLYQRYLAEGGAEVAAVRREYVNRQLQYLRGRVAHIRVVVDVPQAEVAVDDVVVGHGTQRERLLVNAGRRKIAVSATGRLPVTRLVELAGGDDIVVEIKLIEPPRTPSATRDSAPPARNEDTGIAIWPFWAGTAAVGGFAIGYTIKAYGSQKDLAETRDRYGVEKEELADAEKQARRDALIADVLWAGTTAVGGLALVLTLTQSKGGERPAAARSTSAWTLRPMGVGARLEAHF